MTTLSFSPGNAQQAANAFTQTTGAAIAASLRAAVAAIAARLQARRNFLQTVAELEAMDDRLLRDIGLARWQVECYAETGRLRRQN
jgi:uncharacterized protein YjiS (DUF1127 family)